MTVIVGVQIAYKKGCSNMFKGFPADDI